MKIDPVLGGEDTEELQKLIDSGAVTPEAMAAILDPESPEAEKLLGIVNALRAGEAVAVTAAGPVKTIRLEGEKLSLLGRLIQKQLAEDTSYDPAMLLYIEASRAKIQAAREKIIADGSTAGGVVEKTLRQLKEDADAFEEGKRIADQRGLGWVFPDDGYLYHTGLPGYRFNQVDSDS